ncbi:hypothetical protein [Streptomyces sp. DH37]|uniref:hypothetical protein n=1 Tax=Streptomyces sp. DH37 TaxID=3040122 RepID=UPI0024424615|nr:hypothetical protein [Streptomyces sp. DH37]MDG9705522.1 hypothetical protein [Streptomyces sp. DH37]
MPNVEKTPRQTVRVEKELWVKAGEMVGPRRRGAAIRDFLRWLTHETDELPPRPPVPGKADTVDTDGEPGGKP